MLLCAYGANAQQSMSGQQFAEITDGKTLYFSQGGQFYGAEQYLRNNKVRWQFPGGQCTDGVWYAQNGTICFEYEEVPGALCWNVWQDLGVLKARPADAPANTPIELERRDELPLPCAGPDLGV